MSGPDPDQTESSGSYSGGATTAKTAAGNTQGQKEKCICKEAIPWCLWGVLPRLKEELTY